MLRAATAASRHLLALTSACTLACWARIATNASSALRSASSPRRTSRLARSTLFVGVIGAVGDTGAAAGGGGGLALTGGLATVFVGRDDFAFVATCGS